MSASPPASRFGVSIRSASKHYGPFRALDDVSLEVPRANSCRSSGHRARARRRFSGFSAASCSRPRARSSLATAMDRHNGSDVVARFFAIAKPLLDGEVILVTAGEFSAKT